VVSFPKIVMSGIAAHVSFRRRMYPVQFHFLQETPKCGDSSADSSKQCAVDTYRPHCTGIISVYLNFKGDLSTCSDTGELFPR
jgi:hypothetical protein